MRRHLNTVGIVVTIAVGLVGLLTYFNRPRPKLIGVVSYGPVVTTPESRKLWKMVLDARSGSWIAAAVKDAISKEHAKGGIPALETPEGRKAQTDLAAAIRSTVRGYLPDPLILNQLPGSYERIIVRNDGSEVANGVRVSAPDADEMEIVGGGTPRHPKVVAGPTIDVGSLAPLDSVVVWAYADAFAGQTDASSVRVVYSEGIGSVSLATPFTIWRSPGALVFLAFMVACGIVLLVALLQLVRLSRGRTLEKKHEEGGT